MNRVQHLAWAKKRALEYLPGDPGQAVASMLSDLRKYEGEDNPWDGDFLMFIGTDGIQKAQRDDVAGVRSWINGFN